MKMALWAIGPDLLLNLISFQHLQHCRTHEQADQEGGEDGPTRPKGHVPEYVENDEILM
jgi:hypothetical protein